MHHVVEHHEHGTGILADHDRVVGHLVLRPDQRQHRTGREPERGTDGTDGAESTENTESSTSAESTENSGGSGSRRGGRSRHSGVDSSASTASQEIEDRLDDTLEDEGEEDPRESATRLLERALQLGGRGDSEWLHSSAVKSHMRRMDPSFSEKALGYRSFSEFLKANSDIAVLEETGHERLVRAKD